MAHHRALVITLAVVVVVAVVGVGVMALSTNDTDESVQDEVSSTSDFGGRSLVADASPNGKTTIYLDVASDKTYSGTITPLWDSWNDCVAEDYTREQRYQNGDSVALSVTTKCACHHSQMHWRVTLDGYDGYNDVELHEDACVGTVRASQAGERSRTSAATLERAAQQQAAL